MTDICDKKYCKITVNSKKINIKLKINKIIHIYSGYNIKKLIRKCTIPIFSQKYCGGSGYLKYI